MFCTKCGTNNEDNNAFCKNCGAKLVKPATNNPVNSVSSSQDTSSSSGVAQAAKAVNVKLIAGIVAALVAVVMVVVVVLINGASGGDSLFEQIKMGKTDAKDVKKYFDKNNLDWDWGVEDTLVTEDDFLWVLDPDINYFCELSSYAQLDDTTMHTTISDTLWGADCDYFVTVSKNNDNEEKRKVVCASCVVTFDKKTQLKEFRQSLNAWIKKHQKTKLENRKFEDIELGLTFYPLEVVKLNGKKVLACLEVNLAMTDQNCILLTYYVENYYSEKDLEQILREEIPYSEKMFWDVDDNYVFNDMNMGWYFGLTLNELYPEFKEEEMKAIETEAPEFVCSIGYSHGYDDWSDLTADPVDDEKFIIIEECNPSKSDIVIPEKIQGYQVRVIDSSAFRQDWSTKYASSKSGSFASYDSAPVAAETNPAEIVPAETVAYAYDEEESALTEDMIPSIDIDDDDERISITSVRIPEGVLYIGDNAFTGCDRLTNIEIPEGVLYIGDNAFAGCEKMASIKIPNSVLYIGSSAFANCSSLTEITLPNGITEIKDETFSGCSSLKSINIPDSVTDVSSSAFANCSSLTEITLPNGITEIKDNTFSGCSSLTDVKIPSTVTTIGDKAFENCSSLVNINIDNNITVIADNAFDGCEILVSVELNVRFPNAIPKPAWLEAYREYANTDRVCLMDFNHLDAPYLVVEEVGYYKIYHYNGTEVDLVFGFSGQNCEYSLENNKLGIYDGIAGSGWASETLINMDTFNEELYCYAEASGTSQYGHDWDNATYKDRNGEISEEEYDRIRTEIERQTSDAASFETYDSIDKAFQAYISNRGSTSASANVSAANASESADTALATDDSASEYILKDSSSRYLTKDDLQGFSADDCRIARNEIYARHGRKFDDEGLQSHFNSCSWYQGTIEPNDFQETMLSDIEVANKNLIVEYEKEMGYR